MTEVRNPIFARFYARFSERTEAAGLAEHRDELLDGLHGRVLELGAGNGMNFPHYPATVSEVVALEPEPYLRGRAHAAAAQVSVHVEVVEGDADALPFPDGTFDAAVASLVLCTVPDQDRALSELHRVIRPGGELRFYEHVIAKAPRYARFQRAAAKAWPWFAGGCHPDRGTGDAIERAGFVIERARRFTFQPIAVEVVTAPRILGVARRP
jgi:ubiquinone/menaquinone biosynthesis C-methylase UbiE